MSPIRRALHTLLFVTALALGTCPSLAQDQPQAAQEPRVVDNVADLFQIDISDGMLKVSTKLPGNMESVPEPLWVNELDSYAAIVVQRDAAQELVHMQFAFAHVVDGMSVVDGVEVHANSVTIYRNSDGPKPGERGRISVAQRIYKNPPRNKDPHSPLVLKVYDYSKNPQTILMTIRANTFDELLQTEPDKVEGLLRPIFTELKLDDLLGPSMVKARQVFAAECPVDPVLQEKVRALVPQLDAEWASDRDAATKELRGMGSDAVLTLLTMDREDLSPEQLSRINTICGTNKVLTEAQVAAYRHDVKFLLASLAVREPNIRSAALKVLCEKTGRNIEFPVDADAPTRFAAIQKLRHDLLQTSP